jgi:hypothetical protein
MAEAVKVIVEGHAADLSAGIDLSIPVGVAAPQLSAFGSPPARAEAYRAGGFTGDVAAGGSCNCRVHTFSPHLNGTHTEGVGHILKTPLAVQDLLGESLIAASLVSVTPEAGGAGESYDPALRPGDRVITKRALASALDNCRAGFLGALILRTLPNPAAKKTRDYGREPAAFFSHEAMREVGRRGVRHLLVDLPSLDRADDDGKLSNHRLFWDVPPGAAEAKTPSRKTVTELIYIPDTVPDGSYLLNLQVAAFAGDASPSRPVIYKVSP